MSRDHIFVNFETNTNLLFFEEAALEKNSFVF